MRRPRMQFTLRRMMLVVAIVGSTFGCLAWLLPTDAPDLVIHDVIIYVGPYTYTVSTTSSAFWGILLLALTLLAGLLAGFLAVIVYTVKVIRHRIIRKT
jgi:hypothetical protein